MLARLQKASSNLPHPFRSAPTSYPFSTQPESPSGPPPLIICGPSGVGKGTIIKKAFFPPPTNSNGKESNVGPFAFSVSQTTRAPRPGEIDGVDYNFVSKPEMQRMINTTPSPFLEHAEVHSNLYGTTFAAVEQVQKKLNKICLLDIDVQGVKDIKRQIAVDSRLRKLFEGACFVFIAPVDVGTLEVRLRGRKTETEQSLHRRLKNAAAEIEYGNVKGNFDHYLVNDDLDCAVVELKGFVRERYGVYVENSKF